MTSYRLHSFPVSLQVPFRNISEDYEGDVEFTGTLQTPEYVQPLGKNALRMSLALICLDVPLCDHNATVKPGPCRNLEMMCPTFSGILSLESSIKLCQSASKTGLGQCPDVCAAHVVHESSRSHDRNVCALSRRPSTSKSTNSCSNSVADIEEPAHFASPLDKIEPWLLFVINRNTSCVFVRQHSVLSSDLRYLYTIGRGRRNGWCRVSSLDFCRERARQVRFQPEKSVSDQLYRATQVLRCGGHVVVDKGGTSSFIRARYCIGSAESVTILLSIQLWNSGLVRDDRGIESIQWL